MYDSFTSMSPEEERTFIPFEERMQTASKSATVVGFGLAGAIGALVIIIVLAFLVINFVVDALYSALDPRVRLKDAGS